MTIIRTLSAVLVLSLLPVLSYVLAYTATGTRVFRDGNDRGIYRTRGVPMSFPAGHALPLP